MLGAIVLDSFKRVRTAITRTSAATSRFEPPSSALPLRSYFNCKSLRKFGTYFRITAGELQGRQDREQKQKGTVALGEKWGLVSQG